MSASSAALIHGGILDTEEEVAKLREILTTATDWTIIRTATHDATIVDDSDDVHKVVLHNVMTKCKWLLLRDYFASVQDVAVVAGATLRFFGNGFWVLAPFRSTLTEIAVSFGCTALDDCVVLHFDRLWLIDICNGHNNRSGSPPSNFYQSIKLCTMLTDLRIDYSESDSMLDEIATIVANNVGLAKVTIQLDHIASNDSLPRAFSDHKIFDCIRLSVMPLHNENQAVRGIIEACFTNTDVLLLNFVDMKHLGHTWVTDLIKSTVAGPSELHINNWGAEYAGSIRHVLEGLVNNAFIERLTLMNIPVVNILEERAFTKLVVNNKAMQSLQLVNMMCLVEPLTKAIRLNNTLNRIDYYEETVIGNGVFPDYLATHMEDIILHSPTIEVMNIGTGIFPDMPDGKVFLRPSMVAAIQHNTTLRQVDAVNHADIQASLRLNACVRDAFLLHFDCEALLPNVYAAAETMERLHLCIVGRIDLLVRALANRRLPTTE